MKTVVLKILACGLNSGINTSYNPVTKQQTTVRYALTAKDKTEFLNEFPNIKDKFYTKFKPMLAKGLWEFDPALWKWNFEYPNKYQINLWVTVTFTGDGSETKTEFMHYIKLTGIFNYDAEIIKDYS